MQIYNHTQESYDLYDKKSLQSSIDQMYKCINCGKLYQCFRINKYLNIQHSEDLKMIKLNYEFGGRYLNKEYRTGISNESFSFRIYVNKHGHVRRVGNYYFKTPKFISKYQPIPLGKIRVHNFQRI